MNTSCPLQRDFWERLTSWVKAQQQPILVVSHANPDGDAIGSTLAAGYMVQALGGRPVLVNPSPLPPKLAVLPGAEAVQSLETVSSHPAAPFRAVLMVDCADRGRVGAAQKLIAADAVIGSIDHHPTNEARGPYVLVDAEAPATTYLLAGWWRYLQPELPALQSDRALLTALYVGLLTDTGGFRYANTTPALLRLAAELCERGAPGAELTTAFVDTVTKGHLQLLCRALATLQVVAGGKVAWMQLTQADMQASEAQPEDAESIVPYARMLQGVEVGLLVREEKDCVRLHFRSRGHINVGEVAARLGGGGHVSAAGCTYQGSVAAAAEAALAAVGSAFEQEERG